MSFASEMLMALPYVPNEGQRAVADALARFCTEPRTDECVFVLNGYAGTGKTSLTGALVRTLEAHKRPVRLLAPTGRAAKVFSANSGGHQAFTIHRKIYRHNPDGSGASGSYGIPDAAENKIRNGIFIVDEASMIGLADGTGINLLEDLITYVYSGENCRLILIGDTAQLPPVGSERSPAMNPEVLRRMGLKVTVATLTEIARQASDSGILLNATRLRKAMVLASRTPKGEPMPVPKLVAEGLADVSVVSGEDLPDLLSTAYDSSPAGLADTILITRSNRRAVDYNAAIRSQVLYREEELARGDMLIVSRNHYFPKKIEGIDFVANGDIVTIERVYGTEYLHGLRFADVRLSLPAPDGSDRTVEFDSKILLDALSDPSAGISQEAWNRLYYGLMAEDGPYGNWPAPTRFRALRSDPYWTALHVKYAYAVTCHKAQGGQWQNVFVDLGYIPDDALGIGLYRWLYTAVTRARTHLYLIAPPPALLEGGED